MLDPGEALFAVVGLKRALAGSPPSKADRKRAEDLEAELKDSLLAYLAGKRSETAPGSDEELPDTLPGDASSALEGLDDETGLGYGMAAARALAHVNSLAPRRALPGLPLPGRSARTADRTDAERSDIRRAYAALSDPMGTLSDLDAATADQLDAIRVALPGVFSALGLAAAEALAESDRELTGREERALGRILGVSTGDVAGLQALHRREEQEQKTGPAPGGGDGPPGSQTPIQRIAAI